MPMSSTEPDRRPTRRLCSGTQSPCPGEDRSLLSRLHDEERGSSLIEFTLLGTLLLVPVAYLLIAISTVQAAAYAGAGAADQASKVYVSSSAEGQQRQLRSEAAVEAALADFDIDPGQAQVRLDCPAGSCDQDGDIVAFTVEISVPVPLVPDVGSWQSTLVTVSSTSAQVQSG